MRAWDYLALSAHPRHSGGNLATNLGPKHKYMNQKSTLWRLEGIIWTEGRRWRRGGPAAVDHEFIWATAPAPAVEHPDVRLSLAQRSGWDLISFWV